jgi:glycosyltransferase involved in cell wall biosynthesis
MPFSLPKASIVIATYNNAAVLRKVLKAMLGLDYPSEFEVIVVDDGSKDNTREMMQEEFGKEKKIKFIAFEKNQGVCRARNAGIRAARFPIVVNMDHDCIPEKKWLRYLLKEFKDKKVGVVSSFGDFGGTSTAFRKRLLEKTGGYDERYRYYREDTDATFSIMDLGYQYKRLEKPLYFHDHRETAPRGAIGLLKYLCKRLSYHQNDALLFKKHRRLASKFLDVKAGFMVNPKKDFEVVTGTWMEPYELVLSSPRGMRFLENKSKAHALLIVAVGVAYVIAVKLFRLLGSIRFGTLLL